MRNWYYFNWLCGDHIVEQHIHNLDVCNWIKGGYRRSKAQGQGGRQVRDRSSTHGEIFDHHMVEFTYADGTEDDQRSAATSPAAGRRVSASTRTARTGSKPNVGCRLASPSRGGWSWKLR